MDNYPIREGTWTVGRLCRRREGLYTVFSARCRMRPGLWCAWAVGEGEALRIGVLEPEGDGLSICRRFSQESLRSLGEVVEGQLRPVGESLEDWRPLGPPERFFQSPLLQKSLAGRPGVLTAQRGPWRSVAVPRDDAAPFPIEAMFCFAVPRQLGAQGYWVFTFDAVEWPVLPPPCAKE